jgi:ribosomal protein S18 acetylase RimI-like enzyme
MNDREWFELIRGGMPPFWRLLAERSGASVWEEGDVLATVIPAAADRSVFNSVFYGDGERLLGALDRIVAAYDEAGVRAWTVWVPEGDVEVAARLSAAGHVLDAAPRAMGMELGELREPELDDAVEIREEMDMAEVGRLNEVAYGYSPGEFSAVAEAQIPDTRAYFGAIDGETVATVVTWDHDGDVEIAWVATLPEARGRSVGKALMTHAIREAGRREMETTTLVATKLGYPLYDALGYRDFGALQMWERRR